MSLLSRAIGLLAGAASAVALLGASAQANPYFEGNDHYWGGTESAAPAGGQDVVGAFGDFNISKMSAERISTGSGNNDLKVTVYTEFTTIPGPLSTGFGSLFLGPTMAGGVPFEGASSSDTFNADPARFKWVFTMPTYPGGTSGNDSEMYTLVGDGSDVNKSANPFPGNPTANSSFRAHQAVSYKYPSGATPFLFGDWTISSALGTIEFLIKNENNFFGVDFLIAWAMTCANDVMLLNVELPLSVNGEVPLPAAAVLFGSALFGMTILARRRRAGNSKNSATVAAA